jgi:hypothetical protein
MDTQKQGAPQIKVLVIVEVGQTVNVYSDCPGVEVKLLQSPSIEGKEGQRVITRFIESKLPSAWSRLFKAGKPIGFLALPRTKALVVCGGNGAIDVHSKDQHLDIEFFQVPSIEGKDAEIALERFIEVSLPTYWSRIYREGKRIALFTAKPLTLIDAARNQLAIAFCRAVDVDANEANRGAA